MTQVRLSGASRNHLTRRDARPVGPVLPMHDNSIRIPVWLIMGLGVVGFVLWRMI